MYLRADTGVRMRVGRRTVFDIVLDRDAELRMRSPRGNLKHVAYYPNKDNAEYALAEIQAAINRGDKAFYI